MTKTHVRIAEMQIFVMGGKRSFVAPDAITYMVMIRHVMIVTRWIFRKEQIWHSSASVK